MYLDPAVAVILLLLAALFAAGTTITTRNLGEFLRLFKASNVQYLKTNLK